MVEPRPRPIDPERPLKEIVPPPAPAAVPTPLVPIIPGAIAVMIIDPTEAPEVQFQLLMQNIRRHAAGPAEAAWRTTFSPGLNALVLERLNPDNRDFRSRHVFRMSEDMVAARWVPEASMMVVFSAGGRLLNGQNRMLASIKGNTPFDAYTLYGSPDDAFSKMDINAKRNNTDTLKCAKVPHHTITSRCVRWLHIIRNTKPGDEPFRHDGLTNDQVLEIYQTLDHKLLEYAIDTVLEMAVNLPNGQLAALIYIFAGKSRQTCIAFTDDMRARTGRAGRLLKLYSDLKEKNNSRLSENTSLAMCIHTWNSYRRGSKAGARTIIHNYENKFPTIT